LAVEKSANAEYNTLVNGLSSFFISFCQKL
jgi:hypothetical protein